MTASGLLGGKIRFQGRLSSRRPWTVIVTNTAGKVVARGSGRSAVVDWTWNSARVGKGPFRWRIEGGPKLLPAQGSLGAPIPAAPIPVAPAPSPVPSPAPSPAPAPAPAPALPGVALVSGLTVTPSTLTPSANGTGVAADVSFALAAAAQVTVTVAASTGGPALLTLLSGSLPAGVSYHQWNVGVLANGRYKLIVSAQLPDGASAPAVATADVVVDRTLGSFAAAPAALSPNGDGVSDTLAFTFLLTQPAYVQLAVQRAGATVATVWAAQVGPGQQVIGWDGTGNGVRLPDGEYVAVLTSTGALGTVSLLQSVVIDTMSPSLTLLDGPSLRFQLGETATITAVVNGQSIVFSQPEGAFQIPWAGGPVTSFTAQARDAAGNAGPAVSWP